MPGTTRNPNVQSPATTSTSPTSTRSRTTSRPRFLDGSAKLVQMSEVDLAADGPDGGAGTKGRTILSIEMIALRDRHCRSTPILGPSDQRIDDACESVRALVGPDRRTSFVASPATRGADRIRLTARSPFDPARPLSGTYRQSEHGCRPVILRYRSPVVGFFCRI